MTQADLRRGAARLRRWCTGLCLVLLGVLVLELGARAGAFRPEPVPGAGRYGADVAYYRLGLDLLFAVPGLLQLAALWSVRGAVGDVAAGSMFTATLGRMLRQVGFLLFLAALSTLILAPWLHSVAAERYPRLIEFDVANLVLGSLGVILMFLARLFERAVDLQRELDDIF